jgi:hypothetical protein
MEVIPPSGYLSLRDARDILMQRMHKGIPPSENIKSYRDDGFHIVDATQAAASASVLRQAIRGGELALFAIFSSRDTPMRLHDLAVCTENLDPDVVVMKAAKDWVRPNASGPLDGARDRRIFIQ